MPMTPPPMTAAPTVAGPGQYRNRIVTLGRRAPGHGWASPAPAMPAPLGPQLSAAVQPYVPTPTAPSNTMQPNAAAPSFAQALARQGQGGFQFRRPTGPVSAAGANARTQGFAASTPRAFSGTAFGGYAGRTGGSTGSLGRLKSFRGMGMG